MVYGDSMDTEDPFGRKGSNISRLKSMFQTNGDKENRGRSRGLGRGSTYSSMTSVERSPDTKRKRPDSLDTNKNLGNTYKSRSISADRMVGSLEVDPVSMDPQKLYETTNHVQRFQYTRAIFAKMEEENKYKTKVTHTRSVSPAGRGKGVSPLRSPSSQDSSPGSQTSPYKPRSSSEPGHIGNKFQYSSDNIQSKALSPSYHFDTGPGKEHHGSPSSDKHDYQIADRKYTGSGSSNPVQHADALRSKSDSDMFADQNPNYKNSVTDDGDISHISSKSLIEKFEQKRAGSLSPTSGSVTPSVPWHSTSNHSSKPAGHPTSTKIDSGVPVHNSGITSSSSNRSYNSSAFESSGPSVNKSANTVSNTVVNKTSGGSTSLGSRSKPSTARSDYLNKFEPILNEDDDAMARLNSMSSWRQRRQQREKEKNDAMESSLSSVTSSGSGSGGTGVLLPKRRSRDESRLTKEEIEASLQDADSYWQSVHSNLPDTPKNRIMTDSVNSSGSGEEMARSDSNHDFHIDSPSSPNGSDLSPRNSASSWAAKYSISGTTNNGSNNSSSPTFLPRVDTLEKALDSAETSSLHSNDRHSQKDHTEPYLPSYTSSSASTANQPTSLHNGVHQNNSTSTPLYKPKHNDRVSMDMDDSEEIILDEGDDADYVEINRQQLPTSPPPSDMKQPPPFPEANSPNTITSSDDLLADCHEDFLVDKREDGDGTEEPAQPEPNLDDFTDDFYQEVYNPLWDKFSRDVYEGTDMVNQIWDQYFDQYQYQKSHMEPVDGKVEVFEDGNYTYEIMGIPEKDPDEDFFPSAKKPSRIKFSFSPIKVYTTYAVEEYDRKNEDVDPMAASAEYELEKRVERMHQFEVDLVKGSDGLGLSIIGMGVGADAGLEKLGIFIKTLTEGGAAQKDDRIQVNDQIIEVDGKSLVGVTQAYAASVLRNTSGKVKFLIGREKDPQKSEVARLIQQSLEQDRRRAETKCRMEDEQRRLQEEIMRREQALGEDNQFDDISSEISENSILREAEFTAQAIKRDSEPPPLPVSPPPGDPAPSPFPEPSDADLAELGDEGLREEDGGTLVVGEFEMPETPNSSEPPTPEMDAQALFIKLKEAQYKNAVAEAELAKVKAKMIMLENSDSQKKAYEKRCEEMSQRLRETEKTVNNLQKEINHYQTTESVDESPGNMLEGSQGEYIQLERELNTQYGTLEKKYSKAKKLIKEFQTREKDIMQEREAVYQQQTEKEQQYNDLVKTLKDRIFMLENNLQGALKAAGMPAASPTKQSVDIVIPQKTVPVKKSFKPLEVDDISIISDLDDTADSHGFSDESPAKVSLREKVSFGTAVPQTELLDTSANKEKGHLATSGALAQRRPPTRRGSSGTLSSQEDEEEDDPFVQHGSSSSSSSSMWSSDSTVRKKKVIQVSKPAEVPDYPAPAPPMDQSPFLPRKTLALETAVVNEKEVIETNNVLFLESPSETQTEEFDDGESSSSSDSDAEEQAYENVIVVRQNHQVHVIEKPSESVEVSNEQPSATMEITNDKQSAKMELTKSDSKSKDLKTSKTKEKDKASKFFSKAAKKGKKVKKGDDVSETSSVTSQTSYDPNKADLAGSSGKDLIPTAVDEEDAGGITLISAKNKPGSITKLFSPSASPASKSGGVGGGGGITLLSMKPLNTEYSYNQDNGLLPQASTMSLDTGLREFGHSRESSTSTTSSTSNQDLLAEGGAAKSRSYDFQTAQLTTSQGDMGATGHGGPKKAVSTPSLSHYQSSPVPDWTPSQVGDWMQAIKLPQYAQQVLDKQLDGQQLLQLDNAKIKALGITNSKDRDLLKKKLKELKSAIEKERKQRDKEQKAREKLEKQAQKAKKKK